jgi:regulator of cell morphogenesis and NO signaling
MSGSEASGAVHDAAKDAIFSPIIDEILAKHHHYVREEIPRISAILEECADGCGESVEAIGAVTRFFDGLAKELEAHLAVEEDELFPALRAVEAGRPSADVAATIARLRSQHDRAGDALTQTHVALAEALLPEGTAPEIQELHRRLKEFETDLRAHVRAEDLLFARAAGLGSRSAKSPASPLKPK